MPVLSPCIFLTDCCLSYFTMKAILYGQSACEWWLYAKPNNTAPIALNKTLVSACKPSTSIVDHLECFMPFLSRPYHLMVTSKKDARSIPGTKTHVSQYAYPNKSFHSATNNVYVASPELSLLQAAHEMSLHDLIYFAFCFCGSYAYYGSSAFHDPYAITGQQDAGLIRRDPITNLRRLHKCAQHHSAFRGSGQLSKALAYVLENSASPQETLLAMKFTLPYRLGGFNLPAPRLNYQIPLARHVKKIADRSFYVADEYWPTERLIVEYDSNSYHLTPEQKAHDEIRRNALSRAGYKIIVVTQRQASNPLELEKVAGQIAHHLHVRLRPQSQRFRENQRLLFSRRY